MQNTIATVLSGNSEPLIGEAVKSAIAWVDRVLLVDTGISDRSCEIAREIAGERLIVNQFPWRNDFAAARNHSLDAAARHGAKWAMTLDTDERLDFKGIASAGDLQSRLNADPRIRAWLVPARDGSYSKERFICVDDRLEGSPQHGTRPPLVWSGRTHECLLGLQTEERATLPGVTVWEVRKTPEQFQVKLKRDLPILLDETREHPEKPRWWYYLGQTYESMKQPREALEAFRRCAAIREAWAEQSAWACYRAACCSLQLNELPEALELCALGLARQPESPELAWLAGFVCYRLRRYQQAATWSQLAISLGNVEGHHAGQGRISFRHLPAWYEGPYDVLRCAYRKLGLPAQADEANGRFMEARKQREAQWKAPAGQAESTSAAANPGPLRDVDQTAEASTPSAHRRSAGIATRPARVAVLGLYSSGSTATATMLHRLGVMMGREFFADYYEPKWLSEQLRKWWREPDLIEDVPRDQRVRSLTRWLDSVSRDGAACVGAKHPLLTLCANDLLEAWGADTKFIWTKRPIEESIASLERRRWWPGRERAMQLQLWQAAAAFFTKQSHLPVEFADVLGNPAGQVDRIVCFLGLRPTNSQRNAAIAAIFPKVRPSSARKHVLFDIGAHHGEGLARLIDELQLDQQWEVHAFEPNPECPTAELIGAFPLPATVHKAAVWIRDGRVAFLPQGKIRTLIASLNESRIASGFGSCIAEVRSSAPELGEPIEVPCVDLSRLLAERSDGEHIVVKLDVEGAEFAILRHLIERGTIGRIRRLYIEWHERLVSTEDRATRSELERQIRAAGVEVIRWR
jgi:FkbM family methyltransferase